MFRDIVNQDEILQILRDRMHKKEFVPTIFQKPGEKWGAWTVTPGGHILEGHCVLSICHNPITPSETVITLTTSDVAYCRPVGSVRLGGISKIQVLY